MSGKPPYFEKIKQSAARRWYQLESDPELAGPWHQLFKQVQSPRHILSELLQNADDAGATSAIVHIEGNTFIFEHNGDDFTEEHFASLCRFGYSNKRALHTIGFRGIGFKSTFSLGDNVDLMTPTLAVRFNKKRFTEPHWMDGVEQPKSRTRIQVAISDNHRLKEVEKNLDEWVKSPVSLLFFNHIRHLSIGNREVCWKRQGHGPVQHSEWVSLVGDEADTFLHIRSGKEAFPEEAIAEIKQERMLGAGEETEFPPCKVEIVLGASGRLYVVLPTGVETTLPFACNAPFIQDPARVKIKDPETSPTNRWLLQRAGSLAAMVMQQWLGMSVMKIVERCQAYGLMPDVDREDNSLEGVCDTYVEEAFQDAIEEQPLLLTEEGELVLSQEGVHIPGEIFNIWPADQASKLLDEAARPALSKYISESNLEKLLSWELVEQISKDDLLSILQEKHLPRPESWARLLNLWVYIATELTNYRYVSGIKHYKIVPVQGKNMLYSAEEVVRLGERKLLQSEADWELLGKYLIVLNQNWTKYLADKKRSAAEDNDAVLERHSAAAYSILEKTGLQDTSDANKVIKLVADAFFSREDVNHSECIQLAQIAAKLNVTVGESLSYVTRDGYLNSTNKPLYVDSDGSLEELISKDARDSCLLHPDYYSKYTSCSRDEWNKWVESGRSGLQTFVPLSQTQKTIYGHQMIEEEARNRGLEPDFVYNYVTSQFIVEDWDFDAESWEQWKKLSKTDSNVWKKIILFIISQREGYCQKSRSARILHVATTGNTRQLTTEPLLPSWVLAFRQLSCLPDTRGFLHKPDELLRRTPETEALLDVEPFVNGEIDTEVNRPLLDLLGVRSTPTGPERILERLRALARADKPPVHEVEKWYVRLDQISGNCDTAEIQKLRDAFQSEKLILTQDGAWQLLAGVFLAADEEDVPGAATILAAVNDLSLWRRLGIAERPTADLAIQWLMGLPSGESLSQDDARRVRALIPRFPERIWNECGHWLNLAGAWVTTQSLRYALTMQSLLPWKHLHQSIKDSTADLQRLPAETANQQPFSDLPLLAVHIEERLDRDSGAIGKPQRKEWLTVLGEHLCRIELESEDQAMLIRSLGDRLARTLWHEAKGLKIIPYVKGVPAGTSRNADVVWLDTALYVETLSVAKLAKCVPDEIGKVFGRDDIRAALGYGFDRSPRDVSAYMEENFTLGQHTVTSSTEPPMVNTGDIEPEPETVTEPEYTGNGATSHDSEETEEKHGDTVVDVTGDEEYHYDISKLQEQQEEQEEQEEPQEPRTRHPQKPPKLGIMEQFAKARGFRKEGDGRFFSDSDGWIARTNGVRFPWEYRDANGELVCYYWHKDHCLEREPLQLEADIWGLIDEHPETYALILSDNEGNPVEITGSRLRAMRDEGKVTLYPATYRLVYGHDRHT